MILIFLNFNHFRTMDFTDSETQEAEDLPHLEAEYNMPPTLAPECNSFKWKIEVIGNINKDHLFNLFRNLFSQHVIKIKVFD